MVRRTTETSPGPVIERRADALRLQFIHQWDGLFRRFERTDKNRRAAVGLQQRIGRDLPLAVAIGNVLRGTTRHFAFEHQREWCRDDTSGVRFQFTGASQRGEQRVRLSCLGECASLHLEKASTFAANAHHCHGAGRQLEPEVGPARECLRFVVRRHDHDTVRRSFQ